MRNGSTTIRRIHKDGSYISSHARVALACVAILALLCALSASRARAENSDSSETRIEAALSGAPVGGVTPKGEAEFRARADGRRSLEVEVEHVNLPAGTVFDVLVDGEKVGTITLGALGAGQLELESETGQTIPTVNSRTRIVVADQTGKTIIAGAFGDIPATPTPTPNASPTPNSSPTPTPTPGATPTPSPSPTPNGEVRIEARLAGASIGGLTPKGHAKFRARNGNRDLEVEVEHVNLPAGTVLNVLVDGASVGTITLAPTLENELELETERGASVPGVTNTSTVVVTDAQGATILSGAFNSSSADKSGKANDIDDSNFFVQQQYQDFLDREADDGGLDFWKSQIEQCGGDDPACVERSRVNTSGAFFLSIEFQQTGFMLYLFNKETTGEMPRRNSFLVDMQSAAQGVIVGEPGWQQKLEDNKRRAAEDWVNRSEFHARFDGMSDDQFVDALFRNVGVQPDETERRDLTEGLREGTETRATVLRKVSDDASVRSKEQNSAFVLMQYFGYLHRNPDEGPDTDMSGFQFWLRKLDSNGGDFQKAEMVKAFISSDEYRKRFDW